MTFSQILAELRKRKGEFIGTAYGEGVRHKTLKDSQGLPACPLSVLAIDYGHQAWNYMALDTVEQMDIPRPTARRVNDAADYVTHPDRAPLVEACCE